MYIGENEAETSVGGYKETIGKGKREAGRQGAGVSVGGTQHSPDQKQCTPSSVQHPVSAHKLSAGWLVVFQPAALLTNTSAFCLAHSCFSPFPEL